MPLAIIIILCLAIITMPLDLYYYEHANYKLLYIIATIAMSMLTKPLAMSMLTKPLAISM